MSGASDAKLLHWLTPAPETPAAAPSERCSSRRNAVANATAGRHAVSAKPDTSTA